MIETRFLAAALRILRPTGKVLNLHATRTSLTLGSMSYPDNLLMQVTLPRGVEVPFARSVDLRTFGRYVTHTPARTVALRTEGDTLIVVSDTGEARWSSASVPILAKHRAATLPWMEASDLYQALRRVERCLPRGSAQLLQPVPTGEGATFVAVVDARAVQLTRRMPFVPPLAFDRSALDALCPALRYVPGTVQASKSAPVLSFQPSPEIDVWIKMMAHDVADPTHDIPVVTATFTLEVDRERLLQSLRCLRAVQTQPCVRLAASRSKLTLSTEDASITMDVLCRTDRGIATGVTRTSYYRTTHLIEGIDRLHGMRCTLEIGESDQPLTIAAGGNYRYTVMAARASEAS